MSTLASIVTTVVLSTSPEQMDCLAKNLYFEARNQSHLGQIAVAHVTLNRVMDPRFPDTICEVVHQGQKNANGSMKRHKCQFSWYCDGLSDNPRNKEYWESSQFWAEEAVRMYVEYGDLTDGSTHYHAKTVRPYWAKSKNLVARIDDHFFYRWN